jgi:tetratricopeptide (TPR) repeat protein
MRILDRLFGRNPPAKPASADSSLTAWDESLHRADELMRSLDFEEALVLLAPVAEKLRDLPGVQAGSMRAQAVGKLATCHLESGRAQVALPLFRQASELYRSAGDEVGRFHQLDGLYEAHRYLGRSAEAADVADECAGVLDRLGKWGRARRFRKVAELARRGEPPVRVVLHIDGIFFELDELPPVIDGDLNFVFFRNRMYLARATALLERGQELQKQGSLEQALSLFREAGRIDPYAPGPLYAEAAALMHLQRASEAVACYDKVEALAPGWFHCRAERWVAAGIAAGSIPHSAFPLLCTLEGWELSANENVRLARQGLSEAPGVPAFHLYLGLYLAQLGQDDEARGVFAEGLRLAEEPDIRSRLLVQAAFLDKLSPERTRRLEEAMAPGGNLAAGAMAAVMLRTRPAPRSRYRPPARAWHS